MLNDHSALKSVVVGSNPKIHNLYAVEYLVPNMTLNFKKELALLYFLAFTCKKASFLFSICQCIALLKAQICTKPWYAYI